MERHKFSKTLLIDDNMNNLISLQALIEDIFPGSEVFTAINGLDGIKLAAKMQPDVIMLDIVMPDMDGYEVCQKLKANNDTKYIPVVFLTALSTSPEIRIKALESGAEAFLCKPIDKVELIAQIRAMLKIKGSHESMKRENDLLSKLVSERTIKLEYEFTERLRVEEQLKESLMKQKKAMNSIIEILSSAVEARDFYTAGHQKRVSKLSHAIALEFGWDAERLECMRLAGLVHDVGKIGIPSEILSTPRKLSETEYNLVKDHAKKGFDIIKDIDFYGPLAQIVYQHHERLDGSGYPMKLRDGEILPEARILAVADVVEAMSSNRPYRPSLGIDAALEEITQNRGILYDADVVDVCIYLFRIKKFIND
ncbi:MAG: response regulator [Clostridiales bacterium]|nr:response regulator [Clostridiales bacterium]